LFFRCQTTTTRGVVGVGVGVAHLSEATRERLAAASHHQQQQHQPHQQQHQQQQHLSYVEPPNMSQHFIRQRRLSGRENPGFVQTGFNNGVVEYGSLGKVKGTEPRIGAAAANCGFNSGFINAPMGECKLLTLLQLMSLKKYYCHPGINL
jgi:hypothetical protein